MNEDMFELEDELVETRRIRAANIDHDISDDFSWPSKQQKKSQSEHNN